MVLPLVRRCVVWAVLATVSLCMCVMVGGLLGFLFAFLCLGMKVPEATALVIVGALGGVVGTPLCMEFLREHCCECLPRPSDTRTQEELAAAGAELAGLEASEPTSDLDGRLRDGASLPQSWAPLMTKIGWLLLLLLPTVPVAVREWYIWNDLRRDGQPVQAEVVSLGSMRSWRTAYVVSYEFHLANGEAFTRTQEIGENFQQGLRLGGQVPILYLSSDPSVSRVADEDTHRTYLTRMAVTSLAVCIALVGMFRFLAIRMGRLR